MLLRRMIDHVKAQNWTAVVLDFLIVVSGVFIGIQVSNWNADRYDRELETVYLERLHADVLGAIEDQKGSLGWNLSRHRERETFLAALRAGALEYADREAADFALMYVGRINPLRWRWGTARELYATGRITLLRDPKLRDALANAESSHDRIREIVSTHTAMTTTMLGLISNKYQMISSDPVKVDFNFDELAADREFISAFSNIHEISVTAAINFAELNLEILTELEAQIAAALGVDPLPAEPSTVGDISDKD